MTAETPRHHHVEISAPMVCLHHPIRDCPRAECSHGRSGACRLWAGPTGTFLLGGHAHDRNCLCRNPASLFSLRHPEFLDARRPSREAGMAQWSLLRRRPSNQWGVQ